MKNDTPQTESLNPDTASEKPCCNKKSKTLLYIGLVFALLLIIGLVAYTAYMYGKEAKDNEIPVNEANKQHTTDTQQSNAPKLPLFLIEEDFDQENDLVSLSADDLKDLGVKLARTHGGPFVWDNVEGKKGEYDFTLTDEAVEKAHDGNISIFASLWPYAEWDQVEREECKVSGEIDAIRDRVIDYRCNPSDWESYEKFLGEMVERYDGDDNFGESDIDDSLKEKIQKYPILFWEVANEIDIQEGEAAPFYVGTYEDYSVLLEKSYKVIKQACSNCQVAIAAPASNAETYYDEMYELDVFDYFDIYNIHEGYEVVETAMKKEPKPVWISEGGTSGGYMQKDKEDKDLETTSEETLKMRPAALIKSTVYSAFEGVRSITVNMAPDKAKFDTKNLDLSTPEADEYFRDFLLGQDGSRTNNFTAIKTAAKYLDYYEKIEEVEDTENESVFIYKFTFKDSDPVYVYFIGDSDLPVEVTPAIGEFDVNDLFEEEVDLEDGTFTIESDNVYFVS